MKLIMSYFEEVYSKNIFVNFQSFLLAVGFFTINISKKV